ncbi:MAG: hypothetical protein ACYS8W_06010 [Planctomycetota bacterium]
MAKTAMKIPVLIISILLASLPAFAGEAEKDEEPLVPPELVRLLQAEEWDNAARFLSDDLASGKADFERHRRLLEWILKNIPTNRKREPMLPRLKTIYSLHAGAHMDDIEARCLAVMAADEDDKLQMAEEIIAKWPESGWGYFFKAMTLKADGRFVEALEICEKAMRLDRFFTTDYALILGRLSAQDDSRIGAAKKAFEDALADSKERGKHADGYYRLFAFASEHDELSEWGEKHLRNGIKENPEDADLYAFLGVLLYNRARILEAGIKGNSNAGDEERGKIMEKVEKIRLEAIENISKALQYDPENLYALFVLSQYEAESAAEFPWTIIIIIFIVGLTALYVVRASGKKTGRTESNQENKEINE